MKLHVKFEISDLAIDDVIEGEDATEITRKAKLATAQKLGFLMGSFVRAMPDLQFAREVVTRYNKAVGKDTPIPASLDTFVEWAVAEELASEVVP